MPHGQPIETAACRRQIRHVHQRHRLCLQAGAPQQPPQEVLIYGPKAAHAEIVVDFVPHTCRGTVPVVPCEPSPGRLLGQLCDHQVQQAGGSQEERQQMHASELRCDQSEAAAASALARAELKNEIIRN